MSTSQDRDILYHLAMEQDPVEVLPDYQAEYPELAQRMEDLVIDLAKPELGLEDP